MEIFLITLKQIGILMFFVAIGFTLRKTKLFDKKASSVLSVAIVYVITPCYTLINLTENMSIDKISTYAEMFIVGGVITAIGIGISFIITRFFAKSGYMKNVYRYVFAFCNYGFFGYPLIKGVFGDEVLAGFIIFVFFMNVAVCTYGFVILTDNTEQMPLTELSAEELADKKRAKKKHIIKALMTPTVLSIVLGIILGLCSVKLPQIVKDFIQPASDCFSALPMILLGTVLGGFKFKELFNSAKAYVASVIKLIAIPAIYGIIAFILYLINVDKIVCLMVVLIGMFPPGLNIVSYPESFGIDSSASGKLLFISLLMSVVTVPLITMLATSLLGI